MQAVEGYEISREGTVKQGVGGYEISQLGKTMNCDWGSAQFGCPSKRHVVPCFPSSSTMPSSASRSLI